ncbi:VanZ family protein [candidate division WOR-3 bacterium]|nr:VanZ family protein [candidate division WOR-3 bacterium]
MKTFLNSNLKKLFHKNLLPAYIWLTIIFIVSSIPRLHIASREIRNLDTIAHFLEYFIFGLLFKIGLYKTDKNRKYNIITVIIVSLFFASLDEIHQIIVPGRTPSIFDFFADFIGAGIASQIYELYLRRKYGNKSY